MWIVKNMLRGSLVFRELNGGEDLEIRPKSEFDLDKLGREKAENSNQLQVAFEEGYLQNVYKEPARGDEEGELPDGVLGRRLEAFKRAIVTEVRESLAQNAGDDLTEVPSELDDEALSLGDLKAALGEFREAISGDVRDMLDTAKTVLEKQRERVIHDSSLSEAEVKARLAFLKDQERELEKNFEDIGRKEQSEGEGDDLEGKADLLSNL